MNIIRKKVTLMIFYDYALNEKKIKFKFYFKAILFQINCAIFPDMTIPYVRLKIIFGVNDLFGVNLRHQIQNSHL